MKININKNSVEEWNKRNSLHGMIRTEIFMQ